MFWAGDQHRGADRGGQAPPTQNGRNTGREGGKGHSKECFKLLPSPYA